jgi:hypothetical protein
MKINIIIVLISALIFAGGCTPDSSVTEKVSSVASDINITGEKENSGADDEEVSSGGAFRISGGGRDEHVPTVVNEKLLLPTGTVLRLEGRMMGMNVQKLSFDIMSLVATIEDAKAIKGDQTALYSIKAIAYLSVMLENDVPYVVELLFGDGKDVLICVYSEEGAASYFTLRSEKLLADLRRAVGYLDVDIGELQNASKAECTSVHNANTVRLEDENLKILLNALRNATKMPNSLSHQMQDMQITFLLKDESKLVASYLSENTQIGFYGNIYELKAEDIRAVDELFQSNKMTIRSLTQQEIKQENYLLSENYRD